MTLILLVECEAERHLWGIEGGQTNARNGGEGGREGVRDEEGVMRRDPGPGSRGAGRGGEGWGGSFLPTRRWAFSDGTQGKGGVGGRGGRGKGAGEESDGGAEPAWLLSASHVSKPVLKNE